MHGICAVISALCVQPSLGVPRLTLRAEQVRLSVPITAPRNGLFVTLDGSIAPRARTGMIGFTLRW